MPLPCLKDDDPTWFPPLETSIVANGQSGCLAVGGDLSKARLVAAYRKGIFPWYDEHTPILWWSPDARAVIFCDRIHVSRSMARLMRSQHYRVTWNLAFEQVMQMCAAPRSDDDGTWILPEMIDAYVRLFEDGLAQSCEVWQDDELVGGIYGVTLGSVFFGESMFHRARDASKLSLISVAQSPKFKLIDCQLHSPHVESMGARMMSRAAFRKLLDSWC